MNDGTATGLEFTVNVPLLCEALKVLADDIEFIASGKADSNADFDAWERRTSAGLQICRIRAMLYAGELDLAAVDLSTLRTLRSIWSTIKQLNYGSHREDSSSYRGAIFLPHELGPRVPNSRNGHLRKADEEYESYEGFAGYDKQDKEKLWAMFPSVKWITTKRETYASLPDELRGFAEILSSKGALAPPAPIGRIDAGAGPQYSCHVTLLQMAGIVSREKRTLERLKVNGKLPPPDVKGKPGAPDEWRWQVVRPILSKEFGRELPDKFPTDRIRKR